MFNAEERLTAARSLSEMDTSVDLHRFGRASFSQQAPTIYQVPCARHLASKPATHVKGSLLDISAHLIKTLKSEARCQRLQQGEKT